MSNLKLFHLRRRMEEYQIKAYIVPGTDPHQSEYVPFLWQRRQWLSGFTGSKGDLAITDRKAGLWTDSRYFLQAEEELSDTAIILFKEGTPNTLTMDEWLKEQLSPGDAVGVDDQVFSHNRLKKLEESLKEQNIEVKALEHNLVDEIWAEHPLFPQGSVEPHPLVYSGDSIEEKLNRVRDKLKKHGADALVLTALDDIAWLYNIRGRDIDYNPIAIAYAFVTLVSAELFVPPLKITSHLREHLSPYVQMYEYDDFSDRLSDLAQRVSKVLIDPEHVNRRIVSLLEKGTCDILFKSDPVALLKSIKSQREIEGFRAAHVRDGAAMVNFLAWLENSAPQGGVTELSAASKLDSFRAEQDLFQMPSFPTISAYNDHAAIVHYSVSEKTDKQLQPQGIYLVDSGGHYLDGTTDITRTIALGAVTKEQKDNFTRVLKGHIQLAMTRFPKGTRGEQLDTLARKYLWDVGLNYGHGTGHGVGYYLNVHEGPHSITYNRCSSVDLKPGMVVTNEPGYYKTDHYGIRIESILLIVKDEKYSSSDGEFYTFEILTLCPIDRKLIDKALLTQKEIDFLNSYHEKVFTNLAPYVKDFAHIWLQNATREI
jgi:Xaa-Pro aminopeptidase